jgi:hypothetical protein
MAEHEGQSCIHCLGALVLRLFIYVKKKRMIVSFLVVTMFKTKLKLLNPSQRDH